MTRSHAYHVTNPATGETLEDFPATTPEEVEVALAKATEAFATWRRTSLESRARTALRVSELFAERIDELARMISIEMGKPLSEGEEEVEFASAIFAYYAEKAAELTADREIESYSGGRAVIEHLPIGPLLGIMPWNFPYYQVARFVAPNLILGNPIILKHAESCPRSALAIEQLLHDAGVPVGVYANVFATHEQVATMIADPRLRGVSLTGSERAGSAVARQAGAHLKKVVLELGGSDPYIVLDSEDVAGAADTAWETRVYNMGQVCNSNKRIIVHEDIYEAFVDQLTARAAGLRPGDPSDPTPGTYSPMSSEGAVHLLKEQVDDAVSKGARLHAGGEIPDSSGFYYSPAVLTGVTPEMRAYSEELFGPVAVVYRCESDEEAIRLANESQYGLGGAVFSVDAERAAAVAAQLEVGMASVNTPAAEGPEMPFGGVKNSGYGRELGPLGMDEFVNRRLLYIAD
ncbi:NAD-dependent succinate-semialdehyde dehydrogenase [Nesterenkonia sp. LB17]|uniref:NAD-dependent succinate-semialdehyde dehydrogenase n=1 Tax=Nesterenkonia sp. LB17 TaxID=2901230 RepID=UPI001F4CA516|nr:NAD-dependent succinate-semialdehyde dehydrogenase [Nesterenkonia sp. LB17]MCH8566327.1 NAD-dependent succinate-semialdehyde dehydrogenase [Nesterenkonia sp. LB17]